jgi:hypothetical protein
MFSILRRIFPAFGGPAVRISVQLGALIVLFSFLFDLNICAQSPMQARSSSNVVPENGFLSPGKYTNALKKLVKARIADNEHKNAR